MLDFSILLLDFFTTEQIKKKKLPETKASKLISNGIIDKIRKIPVLVLLKPQWIQLWAYYLNEKIFSRKYEKKTFIPKQQRMFGIESNFGVLSLHSGLYKLSNTNGSFFSHRISEIFIDPTLE